MSFTKTQHLFNPWNEGKPVKIGRDGQVMFVFYVLLLSCIMMDWKQNPNRDVEASFKYVGVKVKAVYPSENGEFNKGN